MKNIGAKYKMLTCKFKFDMWRLIYQSNNPLVKLTASSFFLLTILA